MLGTFNTSVIEDVHVKDNPGYITFLDDRIFWTSFDEDRSKQIVISASNVISVRVTPNSKSVQQIAIKRSDQEEETVFKMGMDTSLKDQIKSKNSIIDGLKSMMKMKSNDLESIHLQKIRTGILGSNKQLLALYDQLVVGGVISNNRFWDEYVDEASITAMKTSQKRIIPSGLATTMPTSISEDGNTVVNLSPDVISTIFQLNPKAQKKYLQNVPKKMSDNEFWADYLKCLMANNGNHWDALKLQLGDTQKSIRDAIEENKDAVEEIRRNLDGNDGAHKTKSNEKTEFNLSQAINLHSIRMLKNIDPCPLSSMKSPPTIPPWRRKRYYNSTWAEDNERKLVPFYQTKIDIEVKPVSLFARRISEELSERWKPSFNAKKTARLTVERFKEDAEVAKKSRLRDNERIIEIEPAVEQMVVASNEMLTHFWRCFPATNPALFDKVTKIGSELIKFRNEKVVVMINKTCDKTNMAALAQSLDMLNTALKALKRFQKLENGDAHEH